MIQIPTGNCAKCGGKRNVKVIAHHSQCVDIDGGIGWSESNFLILKCLGCDFVFFEKTTVCSEEIDHVYDHCTGNYIPTLYQNRKFYPQVSKRKIPDWSNNIQTVDPLLAALFEDVYTAVNINLNILAAIAIRTTFDRASELLEVPVDKSFDKKLIELVKIEHISEKEKDSLQALVDAGSAAAHRGWRPSEEDLDIMCSTLENFLQRAFINNPDMEKIKVKIPPRR